MQYGTQGQFKEHTGSIHDIAWAPLAGRSFHLIVTSASDKRILVWRLQVVDLFSDVPELMFDEPLVEVIFTVGPPAVPRPFPNIGNGDQRGGAPLGDSEQNQGVYYPNVLRLKWNVTGTCFAGSAEDGTVSVWQRTINPQSFSTTFTKIAGIRSR